MILATKIDHIFKQAIGLQFDCQLSVITPLQVPEQTLESALTLLLVIGSRSPASVSSTSLANTLL